MLENTKWAHFTCPHSGTRYVNRAVENAIGIKAWQCDSFATHNRMQNDKRATQDFIFCHLGQRWEDWIDTLTDQPHIKTWITVRSPIHTWGTHWTNWHINRNNQPHKFAYERLGDMRSSYDSLIRFAPKVPYIHRVEDGLSGLGEYLGLELEEHPVTFSTTSPMKQALRDKDIAKIEELCNEAPDFWKAFRDYITPDYKDFFENLGYDIWWYNGQRNAA